MPERFTVPRLAGRRGAVWYLELFGSDLQSAEFESFVAVTKVISGQGKRQILKSNDEVLVFLCFIIYTDDTDDTA